MGHLSLVIGHWSLVIGEGGFIEIMVNVRSYLRTRPYKNIPPTPPTLPTLPTPPTPPTLPTPLMFFHR